MSVIPDKILVLLFYRNSSPFKNPNPVVDFSSITFYSVCICSISTASLLTAYVSSYDCKYFVSIIFTRILPDLYAIHFADAANKTIRLYND